MIKKRVVASVKDEDASPDVPSGHIRIDGGGLSANDAAYQSFKHYRALIHDEEVSYKMTRGEMLARLITLKKLHGYISEDMIRRDSVLTLYEVNKEFGSVAAAKKLVKSEIEQTGTQDEVKEEPEHASKEVKTVTAEETFKKLEEARERYEKRKADLAEEDVKPTELDSGIQSTKEDVKLTEDNDKGEDGMVEKTTANGEVTHRRVKSFTYEVVYNRVLKLARELGKVPSLEQIKVRSKQNPDFPSVMTVGKYLGAGWREKVQQELHPVDVIITDQQPEPVDIDRKDVKELNPKKKAKKPMMKKPQSLTEKMNPEMGVSRDAVIDEDDDIQPDLVFDDTKQAKEFLDGALQGINIMAQNMPKFSSSSLIQLNICDATCFIYLTAVK